MIALINNQAIHYTIHGKGLPIFILHGFYLDSITMERAIEETSIKLKDFKRIYIDMPGMGQSERHYLENNSDTMLELLSQFIEHIVEDHPFIIMGYSYGGYMAQAIAEKMKDQVIGEALICPVVIPEMSKRHNAKIVHHEIDDTYFETLDNKTKETLKSKMVVINERTVRRSEADFSRAIALADDEFLEDLYNKGYACHYLENNRSVHEHKTLIFLGYQDDVVGYEDMMDKLSYYPKATVNLLTNACHSFFLEQPVQFEHILNAWLQQYKV